MIYRQPHQIDNARALALWRGIQAAARYLRFCGYHAAEVVNLLARGQ